MLKKILITYFLFGYSLTFFGQNDEMMCYYVDPGMSPREHTVDFTELSLTLDIDTVNYSIRGEVLLKFTALRQMVEFIELDAIDMKFEEIKLDGSTVAQYSYDNQKLIIKGLKLPRNSHHQLLIKYSCKPKRGLYFTGWNDSLHFSRRQVWSQGQGIDNRHWIPMFDDMSDKIISEIRLEFDSKYKVLSNGQLIQRKQLKNGKTFWHYRMLYPHAPYLIMLGIGDYNIKSTTSSGGVNMNFYYYPDREECFEPTYHYSKEMMDFLEKYIGINYPWKTYSQIPVEEFMYGAMENTTATVFGDFLLVDEYAENDRAYLPVNAHELAHQWFGDLITARSSAHIWLQESFATHYNWLVEKEYYGQDHYDWNRRNAANAALNESEKNLYPIVHSRAGSVRNYPKGAFVLHMMKYVMGEEDFRASIKYYLEKHAYKNVDTRDLWVSIYEATGRNLEWFFDQWLYRGGEPHYRVSFQRVEKDGKAFGQFFVEQIHPMVENVGVFKMPIVFRIYFTDGSFVEDTVMVDKKQQLVEIPFEKNKTISFSLFDPNSNILKKYEFEKSFEELKNQASLAPHLLDRYDAVWAMRKIPLNEKRAFLHERYFKETFHAIKEEIIYQLINDNSPETIEILKDALRSNDPLVTRHVLMNTQKINPELKEEYFAALKSKSYINIEKAMDLLYANFPAEIQRILDETSQYKNSTGQIIAIKRFELSYVHFKDKKSLDSIIRMASPSFEFRTRINAFDALTRIGYFDQVVEAYLEEAANSPNHRLSSAAKSTLKFFEKIQWK